MKLRITTLSDNTAGMGDSLLGEWGLSILVEANGKSILLDTGAGVSASHNAGRLGTDLTKIDNIVLSHGHYDHTGGLREMLQLMKKEVEIIAHPDIWQPKYGKRKGKDARYIGIPFQRIGLESLGAVFRLSPEPVKLTDDIITTGEIPMTNDFEQIDDYLCVKENDNLVPDKLLDDQALIINHDLGLVIILGCAHRGMINTICQAQKLTGRKEVYMVIGGSHLIEASEERLWMTISALRDTGVQKLALCHCTGMPATVTLAQEFGENYIFNSSGKIINIPEE